MRSPAELTPAFETTDYCVEHSGKTNRLKLYQAPPAALADWIAGRNAATPAWLITACNPGGQAISEALNRARADRLAALLDRQGLRRLPAINRDTAGSWPDEPGWLVTGLEEGIARSLAQRFSQAAIVAVSRELIDLVWIDQTGA